MLFVGFIALLVLYCTGLIRDLRKGDSESDSDDSDLEEVGLPVDEDDEEDHVVRINATSEAAACFAALHLLTICYKQNVCVIVVLLK